MLKIFTIQSPITIPQMTIVGSQNTPLSNKKSQITGTAIPSDITATHSNVTGTAIPFNIAHPRYPKGTPNGKGGKFMKKGSNDYKVAVASNLAKAVKLGRIPLADAQKAAQKLKLVQFNDELKTGVLQVNNALQTVKKKIASTESIRSLTAKQRDLKAVIEQEKEAQEDHKSAGNRNALAKSRRLVNDAQKQIESISQQVRKNKHLQKQKRKLTEKTKEIQSLSIPNTKLGFHSQENLSKTAFDKELNKWETHLQKALFSTHPMTESITSEENRQLKNNRGVVDFMLENNNDYPNIIVRDRKKVMQAAMLYSADPDHGFYVELLATAPWNIHENKRKVKGAGATAILEASKKSKELGFKGALHLTPLKEAIPFYKHLGLGDVDKNGYMHLSASDAKKLAEKYGYV
jgi:hypothetical protein